MQVVMTAAKPEPQKTDAPSGETSPSNIELEQALLGGLLVNNDVFERISSIVKAEHFYDPLHGEIFGIISNQILSSRVANPATLKTFLDKHQGLQELGGPMYLVRLAEMSFSVHACRDYAEQIRDLSMRRSLMNIGDEMIHTAKIVEIDSSAKDLIKDAEQKLFTLAETGQETTGFLPLLKGMNQAVREAKNASMREKGLSGLATGLIDLDKKLGGLQPSDLIILAGRPSMGKTALATNIAFNIAHSYKEPCGKDPQIGGTVGFFSLEMSSSQLAARILAERSGIPASQVRTSDLDDDQFKKYGKAAEQLKACPLYIDDTPALTIAQIAIRARRLKRTLEGRLHLLIVDYLQLVRPAKKHDSRVNEVSEITQGLKAIAKELDIPVIAISQLSRQVENRDDKRPQLADLRESGSIEQDADVVMFVFRKEYYMARTEPDGEDERAVREWSDRMEELHGHAEVIIGKQRHGPIGTIELLFEPKITKFVNLGTKEDKERMKEGSQHG